MLEALEISGLVTFQDSGRRGWRSYGVPLSGAMDWFAQRAANILAGNAVDAAVIEIGLGEASFIARRNCVVAVTGAGYEIENYVWTFPLWTSFFVRAGWRIHVKKAGSGNWAYLAVAGGFELEPVLNSQAAYLRGGLGTRICAGDMLKTKKPLRGLDGLAARTFPAEHSMAYSHAPTIEVIAGPQAERFTLSGIQTFYESEYRLGNSFDRMGYRLEGEPIMHVASADLISEGLATGSIQVPANGQPIVMMADAPTTGGYPKIANVITADIPLLAQCAAGASKIRFRETTVKAAQEKYRKIIHASERAR